VRAYARCTESCELAAGGRAAGRPQRIEIKLVVVVGRVAVVHKLVAVFGLWARGGQRPAGQYDHRV
jgi:hypothetical protein